MFFFFNLSDAFDLQLLYCTLFCLLQRTDSEHDVSVCMRVCVLRVFDNYDSDDDDDDNDENV